MLFIPQVVANAVTYNFTWPQKLWRYRSLAIGGSNQVASGALESFRIRRDRLVIVTIRFTETEYTTKVLPWLEWAQDNMGSTFTFRFDKDLIATEYTVSLVSPKQGDPIEPQPTDATGILELEVTLRAVSPTSFTSIAY